MWVLQTGILDDFNRIRTGSPPLQPLAHTMHCFDFIRQAILCCGDCTKEPLLGDGMETVRTCKDYGKLFMFAKDNAPTREKAKARSS